MGESSKSIIEHIPLFLNYCKETGLTTKTQDSYKIYLKKFIKWLEKENKHNLFPHEITEEDIQVYKKYLSHHTASENGGPLKKITQNYYLIALRALLGYFTAQDIVSLLPVKINLLGGIRAEKRLNYLNPEQIEALLGAPIQNNPSGLRNRAILAILVSAGLKVAQLKNLNRSQVETKISGEALESVKKYLKLRRDNHEALFINYKSRNGADKRLTARSIEKIVRSCGRKIGLRFLITPEILRWARPQALSREEIIIKKIQLHKTFMVKNYNRESKEKSFLREEKKDKLSPAWHIVENIINKEIDWLKNSIPTISEVYKQNPPFLKHDESILRKIAILIISGKVKADEFIADKENKDLWDNLTENKDLNQISRHGQTWHKKIMDVIHEYFKSRNYKIIQEPLLHYGRADLGVYLNNNNLLYVEIGTVSLFKLWYNLSVMKNTTFLIVPAENQVIELTT